MLAWTGYLRQTTIRRYRSRQRGGTEVSGSTVGETADGAVGFDRSPARKRPFPQAAIDRNITADIRFGGVIDARRP